jgi:glycosyltransferase involved in cell wall biosynthesis
MKLEKLRVWNKSIKKFSEEHSRKKFDLIHSMWAGESGIVASRISRKFGIPLAVSVCGGELAGIPEIGYGSRIKFWQKRFVDKSLSNAGRIVVGSDFLIEKVHHYYDRVIRQKVAKIPFGVNEKLFYPDSNLEKLRKFPVLINISTAFPVKSHKTLIEAFKIVKQKYPEAVLDLYGRFQERLNELAGVDVFPDGVNLKGYIDYRNVPEALISSHIFVLSSLYEAQNLALIEAAFCGLPVVSTDAGSAREITNNIAEPGNHKQLAEIVMKVIENYADEKNKALKLLPDLIIKYSVKTSARSYYLLYKELSGKGGNG